MGQSTTAIKCRKPECPVMIRILLYRKTGNTAPIEARPHPDGNIHIDLDHGIYIILSGEELTKARERNIPLHFNHFATCEYRGQFSKPAPPVPAAAEGDESKERGIA